MRLFRLALLMAAGCVSPRGQSELELRVTDATVAEWEVAGLGGVGEGCNTDAFQVEFPGAAEFDRLCYPATTKTAWACFRWRLVEHRGSALYSVSYPAAILRPNVPSELVEGLAVHEWLHGLVDCTLKRPSRDPYDYGHSDGRVWISGGSDSVEFRARDALR